MQSDVAKSKNSDTELTDNPVRWRWGMLAAAGIVMLSIFPQVTLWRDRGSEWNGGFAFFYTDEPAYASYANALVEGRPRRNDPYTGRDNTADYALAESLFSIQFVPAYLVAIPARALGLSVATVFIVLTPLTAFATALALFWLLASITKDDRAAAAFVPFVLCLGILLSGNGVIRAFLGQQTAYVYLPFLRRYSPSIAFTCFVIFLSFVWLAITGRVRHQRVYYAIAAGLVFWALVYSYFYLWTAALGWLSLVALLWVIARPDGWRAAVTSLAMIGAIAVAALIPYAALLSNRSPTMDIAQALVYTHAPDLWRSIEIIALVILLALLIGFKRRRASSRDRRLLITLSFALLPFVLFNQQIVTGRSLQPMHYEQFVGSYSILIAAALATSLLWRGADSKRRLPLRLLFVIGGLAYVWGMGETWISTRRFADLNVMRDDARGAGLRLRTLAKGTGPDQLQPREVVFTPDIFTADNLPMAAPQAVLWAPHMLFFSGVTITENKERFFQFLYYSGVDAEEFEQHYTQQRLMKYAIFGWERANPRLTVDYRPITAEELATEAKDYAAYVASFDQTRANHPKLSYLFLDAQQQVDLSHLDRWYTRDAGERIGRSLLYRLTPRQN